ncbi:MAG: AAA family ATPase [Candidatus Moraniibacteriota bacterium]
MSEKDFFAIGEERRKLRHEVLDATGFSAHEVSSRGGVVAKPEFMKEVNEGNLSNVAEKVVLDADSAPSVSEGLDRIEALNEKAKEFKLFPDRPEKTEAVSPEQTERSLSDVRRRYAKAREAKALDGGGEKPTRMDTEETLIEPNEKEQRKANLFQELYSMERFSTLQKQGRYRLLRRPEDERLAERLRIGADLTRTVIKRRETLEADVDTRYVVREYELSKYRQQLTNERFVVTPSRRGYIDRIGSLIEQGKPILEEGHTGGGKTELAKYAARECTGREAEVVYCNPQTRQSDIFGRQSLRESDRGATVTDIDFGPLTRALTEGKICIFDEFNELDPRFRQVLKALYNAKPGDMVNVPGNGKVLVAQGFGCIMTANLKSEKYAEKGALEPQETRVFLDSTIRTDYPPASELYDVALSSLADTQGNVLLTREEADTTLKHFTDAIHDIQEAYANTLPAHYGNDTDFSAFGKGSKRGKRPQLEKYVLDTGMAVRLLQGFRIARMEHGTSLVDFLDEALIRTFEGDKIGEEDKRLAIYMLAQKGFLSGYKQEDFRTRIGVDYSDKKLDPTTLSKSKRAELSPDESFATLSAEEVARIDPYERMRIDANEELGLPSTSPDKPGSPEYHSFREARDIFKERFYGPEETEQVFGFRPEAPPIPYTKADMLRHEQLGHILMYNPDILPDGTPFDIQTMASRALSGGRNVLERDASGIPTKYLLYKEQFDENGKILDGAWFSGDQEVKTGTPQSGWQFVSPEALPDTENKNFVAQTDILIENARENFFGGGVPDAFQKAVDEWHSKKVMFKDDANKLASLPIMNFVRERVQNTIFRFLLVHGTGRGTLFADGNYVWSYALSSGGSLVSFGFAVAVGADVYGYAPVDSYSDLRAVASRSGC